jgi:hypothetical protein
VAAWTDMTSGTIGDGDGLGVALRAVDASGNPGPLAHADAHTAFNQFDPDVAWTGSEVVVAWIDESSPASKLDVRYRTFSAALAPLGDEAVLAGTSDAESDVVLAPFASSWAAAWRVATDAGELVRVAAGAKAWSVGPFLPGPAAMKPALVDLDATHLLVVFTQGVDVGSAGTANGTKLSAAVLDVATPGTVVPFDLAVTSASVLGGERPSAARAGTSVFVGWEVPAQGEASAAAHVWLKELRWAAAALDTSRAETRVERGAPTKGDQQRAVVTASGLVPSGGVVIGWEDLGLNLGNAKGEVGLEVVPLPVVRLP